MRYKPEEIVAKLRPGLVSQGQNIVDAIRQIGVSEVTYYRWCQEFGGLNSASGVTVDMSGNNKAASSWSPIFRSALTPSWKA